MIKWGGGSNDKYVTRSDSSPLFEALVAWRQEAAPVDFVDEALKEGAKAERGMSSEEIAKRDKSSDEKRRSLSKAGSSWSRWWRGSSTNVSAASTSPPTPSNSSGSLVRQEELGMQRRGASSPAGVPSVSSSMGGLGEGGVDGLHAEVDQDQTPSEAETEKGSGGKKRKTFAKTLRLTSEQLVRPLSTPLDEVGC